jgi:hypothetical protein
MARRVSVAFVVLLFGLAGRAPALVVTTPCGVEVPRGEPATLQGDVACSADAPVVGNNGSIWLRRGARLELNGYTIRLVGTAQAAPIYCDGTCTVVGPGRISSDVVGGGVVSFGRGRITVQDVTMDTLIGGVYAPFARRVTLGNVGMDVKSFGVAAPRVVVNDVTINLTGSSPGRAVDAIGKGLVKGTGLVLTGCGDYCINAGRRTSLADLTSVGGFIGINSGGTVTLVDSSVTGSTYRDIVSRRLPRLTNTTCGRSGRSDDPLTSWGVCSDD